MRSLIFVYIRKHKQQTYYICIWHLIVLVIQMYTKTSFRIIVTWTYEFCADTGNIRIQSGKSAILRGMNSKNLWIVAYWAPTTWPISKSRRSHVSPTVFFNCRRTRRRIRKCNLRDLTHKQCNAYTSHYLHCGNVPNLWENGIVLYSVHIVLLSSCERWFRLEFNLNVFTSLQNRHKKWQNTEKFV